MEKPLQISTTGYYTPDVLPTAKPTAPKHCYLSHMTLEKLL